MLRVPGGRDLEDGPVEASGSVRRAVEVAIAGLDEPREGEAAIRAAIGGEGMQNGEGAGRRDLEDGAAPGRADACGRAVEVAIAGLDEPRAKGEQPSVGQSKECSVVTVTVPAPSPATLNTVRPRS